MSWFLRMKPLVDIGSLSDRGFTLAFVYGPIAAKTIQKFIGNISISVHLQSRDRFESSSVCDICLFSLACFNFSLI